MSKPSPLLAQLKRITEQAQHGGNVVSLPVLTAAPLPAPAGDPAGNPEYSAMLAELDAMVPQQNAAQAHTDAEEDGRSGPGLASVAASPAPGFGTTLAAQVATLTAASAAAKASGPVTASQGIDLVNLTHFVATLSGEATIWREGVDAETSEYSVVPVSQSSFRLEFAPLKVGVNTANGIRTMSIADIWLGDKRRREYPGGVVFEPEGSARIGCFNTWRGFGVTPKAGDPSPMIDHVYMLCGGSALLAEYMLNWLAFVVQRPGTRPEVAMVLRGGQGTGKGTVVRIVLAIFGPHGLHITQPRHLTGNFNSHLRRASR